MFGQNRRKHCLWVVALALAVVASCGCNRNSARMMTGGQGGASNVPPQTQQAPFKQSWDSADGISPSESLVALPHQLPAGTALIVRLQSGVFSESAHPGDDFEAVLDEPIIIGGQTIVPRGVPVKGRVLAAKPSGRLQDPGYLRLGLASITLNGKTVSIQTSSISVKGKSHEKHNWSSIGGGLAAGALIGGLAGGGKGALVGSSIGGAGGTGFAYATGKKDVGFGAERRLTFRLTGALDVKG